MEITFTEASEIASDYSTWKRMLPLIGGPTRCKVIEWKVKCTYNKEKGNLATLPIASWKVDESCHHESLPQLPEDMKSEDNGYTHTIHKDKWAASPGKDVTWMIGQRQLGSPVCHVNSVSPDILTWYASVGLRPADLTGVGVRMRSCYLHSGYLYAIATWSWNCVSE